MSRLDWSDVGSRFYEAGVDRGVLYVDGQPAVVWTGLISVEESSSGGETRGYYIDGEKYLNVASTEEFEATLTAFTYPDEFAQCEGTSQIRPGLFATQQYKKSFGLCYRTKIGNDIDGVDHGYKIHLIYNALGSPSPRAYGTINDTIEPMNFKWNLTTRAQSITGHKPTAHFVIDSRYTLPEALVEIENVLYGSDSNSPRLPTYTELLDVFDSFGDLVVVDNGDGTFTISAPNSILRMLNSYTFEVTAETAVYIDDVSYTITS
jgi:hypothetical protein